MIKSVRVLGIEHRIFVAAMADYTGILAPDRATIIISPYMDDQFRPNIVMHESIHSMFQITGHGSTEKEDHVIMLGNAIVDFIRSNPEFVKWVMNTEMSHETQEQLNAIKSQYKGANNGNQT